MVRRPCLSTPELEPRLDGHRQPNRQPRAVDHRCNRHRRCALPSAFRTHGTPAYAYSRRMHLQQRSSPLQLPDTTVVPPAPGHTARKAARAQCATCQPVSRTRVHVAGGGANTFVRRHAAPLERRTSPQNDQMDRDPGVVFSGPHGSMVEEPSQSSEFRGGEGGGGVCSRSSTARWFGHPPLQTIAQGHHTLGELREESPRRHSTWMPKRGSCGSLSALSCRPPESLISPPFVPSRLPQLGQESLLRLQAPEGARRSEAQPSRLGGAVTQQMNMQMQI